MSTEQVWFDASKATLPEKVARIREDFAAGYVGGTWTHWAVPTLFDALEAAESRLRALEDVVGAAETLAELVHDYDGNFPFHADDAEPDCPCTGCRVVRAKDVTQTALAALDGSTDGG